MTVTFVTFSRSQVCALWRHLLPREQMLFVNLKVPASLFSSYKGAAKGKRVLQNVNGAILRTEIFRKVKFSVLGLTITRSLQLDTQGPGLGPYYLRTLTFFLIAHKLC